MAGDPGIDLGPGLFQPGAQLIGLGKLGGRDQNRANEQLPLDGQLPSQHHAGYQAPCTNSNDVFLAGGSGFRSVSSSTTKLLKKRGPRRMPPTT